MCHINNVDLKAFQKQHNINTSVFTAINKKRSFTTTKNECAVSGVFLLFALSIKHCLPHTACYHLLCNFPGNFKCHYESKTLFKSNLTWEKKFLFYVRQSCKRKLQKEI